MAARKSMPSIEFRILPDGIPKKVKGRDSWLLRRLLQSGGRGVTTQELPAGVRASHYVYKLRKAGVVIESAEEQHGGDFAGRHSRYILKSSLEIIADSAVPTTGGAQ